MNLRWQRRHFIATGLAIVLLSNAVVLGGVAYNRSGEPEARLRLSERELEAPWREWQGENSGLAMRLRWRTLPTLEKNAASGHLSEQWRFNQVATWLDAAKLAELGFDVRQPDARDTWEARERRALEKTVFLVLEFDGPAHAAAVKLAEELAERVATRRPEPSRHRRENDPAADAASMVDRERNRNSRLFVVDAGLDAAALRARHPDRSRYAVVTGRVRPYDRRESDGKWTAAGVVSALNVEEINVPVDFRPVFEGLRPDRYRPGEVPQRFEATVVYGRRFEPTITAASRAN